MVGGRRDTRAAIWVQVDVHGASQCDQHAPWSRNRQVTELLGEDWIANARFPALPAIVCGDLNAIPSSPPTKAWRRIFATPSCWPKRSRGRHIHRATRCCASIMFSYQRTARSLP
ncbi:endonuclease/exonuclease/phosphatase family protein [Rhizobium sp. BK538]|uniref:endonuclease/exonuclease/phosphatase family protein n=1 Tax=Rhizobium sp. BK538 TaxID=2586984 RepID=UPI0032B1D235